jgi:NADPH:quinone reductase
MRAVIFEQPGEADVLHIGEVPEPQPGPEEVLIAVAAAGVSRADIMQRQGKYPPPPGASDILGLDVAGTVRATGSAVREWHAGDRVCALLAGGGYAEYAVAPAAQVLPVPEGWSEAEAVTLPENLFTVYDNLVTRARLAAGERLLVHGGTSGIGTMAIMLARAIGAIPYATAGSDAKCEAAVRIGAEAAINYRTTSFVDAIRKYRDGTGVDVVLDLVGAKYLSQNIDALALEGRLAMVATLGGNEGMLPIHKLMTKRLTIVASTLRARTVAEKGAIAMRLRKHIWPLLPARTAIRPLVDAIYPFTEAQAAHQRVEQGEHIGKVVLAAR